MGFLFSFGGPRKGFSVFSVLGSRGGDASSQRLFLLGSRGLGGPTDDRSSGVLFSRCFSLLFCLTTCFACRGSACWACTSSSSASSSRCFPQAIASVFFFSFLRLVTLCVSLWLVGFPLTRFLLPVSRFWVVGLGVSPAVLLHLASLLRVG